MLDLDQFVEPTKTIRVHAYIDCFKLILFYLAFYKKIFQIEV